LDRTVLTFTEYSSKSLASDLRWNVNDPRLDYLEQINAQNGDNIFSVGRKSIKASKYVGLIRLGDITLQILPKIADQGNFDKPDYTPEYQQAVRSAMHNLLVMLSVACDVPLRAQDSAQLHNEPGDWLEILTRLFALELHRQLKLGLSQSYVTVEDRLPVIRGSWLIGRQLSRFPTDRLHFDVSYDEFSVDTPLNRLFSSTADALWRLTQDSYNRRLLLDLREWLRECKPNPPTLQSNISKIHFTRLNERFRPAANIARLFWEQRLVQLSAGGTPAFAFVFDMNRLFQDFIAILLKRHQREILPEIWQDADIILRGQNQKAYLAERVVPDQITGKLVFPLFPDILLLSPQGAPYLIGDTKYKRLSPQLAHGGVAEGDIYQVLAYARKWNCSQVLLLYPSSGPFTSRFEFQALGTSDIGIKVVELNLQQPLENPLGLIKELQSAFKLSQ
jgi:5-methylcytosine-specific restriction enzyme subunit McrC